MGDVIPSFLIICYLPTTSYPQNLHQIDIRPFLGMVVGGELNRYKKFLPLAKSKNDTIQWNAWGATTSSSSILPRGNVVNTWQELAAITAAIPQHFLFLKPKIWRKHATIAAATTNVRDVNLNWVTDFYISSSHGSISTCIEKENRNCHLLMHCTQKVLSEIAGFDGLDIRKMHSFDNDFEFLLLSEWRNDNQCNFLALGRKLFQECTVQDSVYKCTKLDTKADFGNLFNSIKLVNSILDKLM